MKKYFMIIGMIMIWAMPYMVLGSQHTMIKVGLESIYKNASSISLSSDKNIEVGYLDENGFRKLETLSSSNITITKNEDSTYCVRNKEGQKLLTYDDDDLVFRGYDNKSGLNLITVGENKKYRGAIGIGGTTGITPYNLISIEEYLYGVVPNEMIPSWPEEALKAQAVAARTIAHYQYNRFIQSGYNVVDTTTSQAYGGYNKEHPRTTAAVDATKGEIVYYKDKIAETLYFSTSGGYTESAENVWGSDIPYLVSQIDTYETEPEQADWTRLITLEEIDRCLGQAGAHIGKAKGIEILSRTPSGRVKEMNIIGTEGLYPLTLEKVRTFFSATQNGSLKSRLFEIQDAVTDRTDVPTTNTVTLLSASGLQNKTASSLYVTNGQELIEVSPNKLWIQTATTLSQLQRQNVVIPIKEIVYGDVTIKGKGFGHGVGMSQSGAKGMANAGFDYKSILTHYYKGVTIKS